MTDDVLIFICCTMIAASSYALGWVQCRQSMNGESSILDDDEYLKTT